MIIHKVEKEIIEFSIAVDVFDIDVYGHSLAWMVGKSP